MGELITVTSDTVDELLTDLPRMVRLALGYGAQLRRGTLDVTLPDGRTVRLGGNGPGPRREIETREAEHDRERTAVQDREEIVSCMTEEIGESHQTGEDESRRAREQADREERAEHEFERARIAARPRSHRHVLEHRDRRELQNLGRAELQQAKTGNDA